MVTFNNLFKEIAAAENATKKSDKVQGSTDRYGLVLLAIRDIVRSKRSPIRISPYISDKKFGIFSKKSEPKEQKIEIPKMMEDPKSRKREIESGLMDVFLERQEHGLTKFYPISNRPNGPYAMA